MFLRGILAVVLATAAPVQAFPILSGPQPVVEYYNVHLGHYFMTVDPSEMDSLDRGRAGPGWVRTGFGFLACENALGILCTGLQSATVRRFYGTPGLGPNSHFYTADPAEAAGLDRPGTGWTFEKIAFFTAVPDAGGHCAFGTPVHRLYNQRAAFNDSNHRYLTSDSERARMVAQGWYDEGVRFCSDGAIDGPIKRFSLENGPLFGNIRPSAQCEDESLNVGPCLAVNNLPPPVSVFSTPTSAQEEPFFQRTGYRSDVNHVVDATQGAASVGNVFLQGRYLRELGIHIDTRSRGPNAGSSVNPLYQLSTRPGARFFPFGTYDSDVELSVSFAVFVKTIEVRSPGGSAFGHPTLEMIDQRSGRHVYFTTLAYGTVDAIPVFIAFDSGTGRPIVGTSFRADSPYIRTLGLPSLPTPSGFVSPNPWGWGGDFEYRMDRGQFKRVIDAWRTLVPELSTDPADYFLDNFHFNNEIGGEGEIGIWLRDFQLRLLRR
jgi:hypothetical protein